MRGVDFENGLAGDQHFRDAVLCKKLAEAGPLVKETLNTSICRDALNWVGLCQLHLNVVAGGDMKAAMSRLFGLLACMEESKYLSTWVHGSVQVSDNRRNERFRQVVEGCP